MENQQDRNGAPQRRTARPEGREQDHDDPYAEVIAELKKAPLPSHVAIIMDGNGRWAKMRERPRVEGHREGINSVRDIVRAGGELNLRYLTLFTFSTENWHRPKSEVSALMSLLLKTIYQELEELKRNNVRLRTIGRLQDLPYLARQGLEYAMRVLDHNTGLTLNLALSYSSRDEITEAVRRIAQEVEAGRLNPAAINGQTIAARLYTSNIPDPDLLIRTSGELRISNFLLWQLAYTEIYVTDVHWPDFRREEFYRALQAYQKRERRYGRVSEQLPAAGLEENGKWYESFVLR